MISKLFSKYQNLQDMFFIKQLDSFSTWLDKEISIERNVYLIETKYISKKVSKEKAYKDSSPFFIFCEPQLAEGAISQFSNKELLNNQNKKTASLLKRQDVQTLDSNFRWNDTTHNKNNNWIKIFSHPDYEIYENISTLKEGNLPLHFGLSKDEQKFALELAREVLELEILKKKIKTKNIFNRFNEKCDVDVTLWSGGRLRGSQIVFGLSLYEGIIEATKRSYNDKRFPKIKEEEIKDVRVEVTLLHSLQMPLMYKDIEVNIPLNNKVYSASVNEKSGWYLPATFNCINFKSLNHLANSLFSEKMSLEFSPKFFKNIFMGEVSDYVERDDHKDSIVLDGPIPQIYSLVDFDSNCNKTIARFLDYLERIQSKNGNILTKVNPLTGLAQDNDLVRLCFTNYALFFYSKAKNDLRSKKIAEKGFLYIKNVIGDKVFDSDSSKAIAYIYYAQATKFHGDEKEYKKSLEIINNLFDSCKFEPILYSQYVLLLLSEKSFDESKAEKLVIEILFSFKDKEKRLEEIDLASYAELPKLLIEVSKFSKDKDSFEQESKKIIEWYLSKQKEDGSFYSTTTNKFSYTRGTGKVLEVLTALENISSGNNLQKAFVWCMNMQYNEENNYFIPKEWRVVCNGGLRHDYFNHEIWIDAVGHLLVAFANLDKK